MEVDRLNVQKFNGVVMVALRLLEILTNYMCGDSK